MEGGPMTRNTKPEVFEFPRPTLPPIEDDHSFGPWSYDDRRNAALNECRQYPPAKLQSEIARYSTMLMEAESREHIARHEFESQTNPVAKLEAKHKLEETIARKLGTAEVLELLRTAALTSSQRMKSKRGGRPRTFLVATRQSTIRKVSEQGLTGLSYCQKLAQVPLSTPVEWRLSKGCPVSYVDAYTHPDPTKRAKFQHMIQNEKSKNSKPRVTGN
jgi:hypothetical protein